MPPESFLETLYLGAFDRNRFDSIRVHRDTERVRSLLRNFQEILEEYPPHQMEEEGRIPLEMLSKMGKAGLFGVSIPEVYGGLGFELWEYLRSVEQMAQADISVAMTSLAHLSIGIKGIVLFGSESQKQKYLPLAASGEMIFSYALTEPLTGSDACHIQTRAELSPDGTGYVLNGHKTTITNANYAGGLTVFAQMDPNRPGTMGAFIVETAWEGVQIGMDMPKMGLKASSTAAIHFKNVRVPRSNLLGKPGEGFKIAMSILNYGRLGLGAGSVGLMNRSLQDMVKRATNRIQFGVPISSFELIQEKLVKARVHSAVSEAMNSFTAGLLHNNPHANVAMESSHCKLFGTTRAWDTLYEALQVAGGTGYLATQPYEKRMRDFRVATVFEGTTEIHSIYPPLFVLRELARQLQQLKETRLTKALFLLKGLWIRTQWPLHYKDKTMEKASRLARANVSTIRRMLLLGTVLYGKKASEKEFFMRRVNTLSLYTFGILALLARMTSQYPSNRAPQEDRNILGYFVEEAREARRENRRFWSTEKERWHVRIMRTLCPSSHSALKTDGRE